MSEEDFIPDVDYNADDPEQVNRARKIAARKRIQREEVIRGVMSVKEGRAWVASLLAFCDVHGNPHVSGDPYGTAFNCGMANVGKKIWDDVQKATPKFFIDMLKEVDLDAKQQEQ